MNYIMPSVPRTQKMDAEEKEGERMPEKKNSNNNRTESKQKANAIHFSNKR